MNPVLLEDLNRISEVKLPWELLKGATVFVTGATGLVGSMLIKSIVYISDKYNLDTKIVALVRSADKLPLIYSKQELDLMEVLYADVTEQVAYNGKVDYVFHCASVTASKQMVSAPVDTIMTAVLGTQNVLDMCDRCGAKSVVYVSSMEMYGTFIGEEAGASKSEDELGYINPLLVRSNYPESKRLCENLCVAYLSQYNVPVKIARLSQTFGAGVLPWENRVFAQFARSAMNNQDIVLHTKGLSEGNYCYLADCIEGILRILLMGQDGEAYNVVNEETHTTIANMAQMVATNIANGRIEVSFDIPELNVYGYASDTKLKLSSKKLRNLGWEPKMTLEDSFRRMIDYLEIEDNKSGND